jgi:hypothetical protein
MLKFEEIDWINKKETFSLYVVRFKDDKGNIYEWVPKWQDLAEVFHGGVLTENLNSGKDWTILADSALTTLANILSFLVGQPITFAPRDDDRPRFRVRLERRRKP